MSTVAPGAPTMEVIEQHRRRDQAPAGAAPGRLERLLHRPGTAVTILMVSLVLTCLAWLAARHFALQDAHLRFERRSDDVQARIERRLTSYEALLRGGVALFAASGEVTREQWRRYAGTVQPDRRYPGIQGLGFCRLVQPQDLAAHEATVRAEGFPDYRLRPAGQRDLYGAIVYLEPFEQRNLRAFGFDMLSEPTRREAMLRARDVGDTALSGSVRLVQEDGRDVQNGFLIYVPVYRSGTVPDRVDQRREQLLGWVYAPFRANDLMQGILGDDLATIGFRIHDGPATLGKPAFYDSAAAGAASSAAAADRFERRVPLVFAGRHWTITFHSRDLEMAADTWQSNLVALAGLTIDLLLYWSISQLARRKRGVEDEVRRRTAEARRRTAWLDAVSDLSPNGVLVFDADTDGVHRLVFSNPTFSQLFELRQEDLLGLSEGQVNEWLSGLVRADATAAPLAQGEASVVLAGPPTRVLERRMRESGQQRVYYFRDTTRESELDRLKGEFLTTAAHELRTPLASVYGFSELLMGDKVDPSKRQRVVAIVHRQAGVLKHLVDELLDLARLDSKRDGDFHRSVFNLREAAQEAVETVARPDRAPRVLIAPCGEALWVNADKSKMRQVVLNLVSNALKYSSEDSIVTVGLTRVQHLDRTWARVQVVDQGIGMTPEELARASERFYRADPSGHIPGTGLGLAITKEIVELHQGRLAIRSRRGEGTEVSVELPLCGAPTGPGESPAPARREPALA